MSMPAVEAEIRIDATPDSVYHALTDEAGLRIWFAEQARVDLDRGIYTFSGRYTPGEDSPDVRLLRVDPERGLEYSWPLDGVTTTVAIQLQPRGDATHLTLHHRNLLSETAWLYECFWSLALENLRAYSERGQPAVHFDFSAVPTGDVEISTEIDAGPEEVFDALIDPAQLDRYMSGNPARVEPRAGGDYDVGWENEGPVKILDLEAGRKLSYSWKARDAGVGDTIVTWTVDGSGGRTYLTLVHSGFAADRSGLDFGIGWLDYVSRIKRMVESGDSWQKPSIRVVEGSGLEGQPASLPSGTTISDPVRAANH